MITERKIKNGMETESESDRKIATERKCGFQEEESITRTIKKPSAKTKVRYSLSS